MEKGLRKKHRQVWLTLAVLLPAGIAAAWLVIPNPQPVKIISAGSDKLLPLIQHTAGTADFQVNIRTNGDKSAWQLEWINKTPLTTPSAVIYKTGEEVFSPSRAELVGRIETKGRYVFPLQPDTADWKDAKLVLYDFIHEQKIDSINF
jgi:hypothetical protein